MTSMPYDLWFERAGTRLYAVADGTGEPIIFLHGGLANHLAAREVAAPLAARFRLVTPDLRGSGRSIYSGPLAFDQLADDLAALIEHLGAPRAIVGGVSFGAACAVAFALRHPRLLRALVIVHPAYAGADLGLTAEQTAAMHAMNAAGSRAIAEGVGVLYPLFAPLPDSIRARALAMVDTFDPASVATHTRFLASGAQPFAAAAELAAITTPALLVPGTDPYHPTSVSDVYARHLPHCTIARGDVAVAIGHFAGALPA